jgi:hypothetical protein
MMPVKSDDPLRRVTLNLYEADCEWLEEHYGRGWTERVRQAIHMEVHKHTRIEDPPSRRTLGDLIPDNQLWPDKG